MRMRVLLVLLLFPSAALAQPDASDWRAILETYATADGGFRYAALHSSAADRARLERFVTAIGSATPSSWPRDAQLSFYIDAYNALTVRAIIERWPIESVMRVPGFFDRVRHRVAGRSLTLNQLENDVIRPFREPRIHFAVNCASAGCPPLARTPYTGGDLDAMLTAQTDAFVRRTTRFANGTVTVSRIFEWYASDFEASGGVRTFVAAHTDIPAIQGGTRLVYSEYDWDLNDRP